METRTALLGLVVVSLGACTSVVGVPDKLFVDSEGTAGMGGGGNGGGGSAGMAGAGGSGGNGGMGGPGGGPSCTLPEVTCGGACVNITIDGNHCGSCGHSCLGGLCQGGSCWPVEIAVGQNLPTAIALDGNNVYWINAGSGSLHSMPKSGGTSATLRTMLASPTDIATDGVHVFGTLKENPGTIYSIRIDGTQFTVLSGSENQPHGIAIDSSSVYWTTSDGLVKKMSLAGGTPTTLASQQASPSFIVVDATRAFWLSVGGVAVRKIPIIGGVPSSLATNQDSPGGIAAHAGKVIWTVGGTGMNDGAVLSVDANGGTVTPIAPNVPNPWQVAVDDAHVFWTNQVDGFVMQASRDGGAVMPIAAGQASPNDIAVDDKAIYWTNSTPNGKIMKLAK